MNKIGISKGNVGGIGKTRINSGQNIRPQSSFHQILDKTRELKFSKHASQRLDSRRINLSEGDMSRLKNGVDMAKKKGVREALIMMDNKVFVASIKNNTVITASTDEQLKENVFTNIDGAVIV